MHSKPSWQSWVRTWHASVCLYLYDTGELKDKDQWMCITMVMAVSRELKMPPINTVFELEKVMHARHVRWLLLVDFFELGPKQEWTVKLSSQHAGLIMGTLVCSRFDCPAWQQLSPAAFFGLLPPCLYQRQAGAPFLGMFTYIQTVPEALFRFPARQSNASCLEYWPNIVNAQHGCLMCPCHVTGSQVPGRDYCWWSHGLWAHVDSSARGWLLLQRWVAARLPHPGYFDLSTLRLQLSYRQSFTGHHAVFWHAKEFAQVC